MSKYLVCIIILFISSLAKSGDYQEYLLLHYSNYCSNYFDYFEKKYKIPKHLLRSISVVETGRWHSKAKIYLPWPWAVNQGGKSYYLKSKKEAIEKVKSMLQAGITNIDIGCMQINLHHHPKAFLNLTQAFDPKENIEYAANFLTKNYQASENWQAAIAAYHSQGSIGYDYAKRVLKIWSHHLNDKPKDSLCISNKDKTSVCQKEELISTSSDDKTIIVKHVEKKDFKRLKSPMITYSISNEQN